jgi:hypothetical protein
MPSFENPNLFQKADAYKLPESAADTTRKNILMSGLQKSNANYEAGLDPNNSEYVVHQAEKITQDAADPQRTESYYEAEGFNELVQEGHDFETAAFLLHASGVKLEQDGSHQLRWESEQAVHVPPQPSNGPLGDPRLN